MWRDRRPEFSRDEIADMSAECDALLVQVDEVTDDDELAAVLGLELRDKVLDYFYAQDGMIDFVVHGNTSVRPQYGRTFDDVSPEADWENLQDLYFNYNLNVDVRGGFMGGGDPLKYRILSMLRMATVLERQPLIRNTVENVREIIDLDYDDNVRRYGAKFAQLQGQEIVADALNQIFDTEDLYQVPEYDGIECAVHQKWLNGEDIDEDIYIYWQWAREEFADDGIILRSSGDTLEDSETTTAAGIYESVEVLDLSSFEDFKAAVEEVYRSANTVTAKDFRRMYGVEGDELLGVVVQRRIETQVGDFNGWGYGNSVVPGVPELMELYWRNGDDDSPPRDDGKPDIFERRKVPDGHVTRMLLNGDAAYDSLRIPLDRIADGAVTEWHNTLRRSDMLHFGIDTRKIGNDQVLLAGFLMAFNRAVFKSHVQVELGSHGQDFYIFQNRKLPESFQQTDVEFLGFPEDEQPLLMGRAIGVANGVSGVPIEMRGLAKEYTRDYDGISCEDQNKGRILVVENSWGLSTTNPEQLVGLEAVVIIDDTGNREFGRGGGEHIETLCAELGIPCSATTNRGPDGNLWGQSMAVGRLLDHETLVVYADGLNSQVYVRGERRSLQDDE